MSYRGKLFFLISMTIIHSDHWNRHLYSPVIYLRLNISYIFQQEELMRQLFLLFYMLSVTGGIAHAQSNYTYVQQNGEKLGQLGTDPLK